MIDYSALFRISYGLYIVCSGNREHGNGFISNTVFQVTSEPVKIAVTCSKKNFSADLIRQTGAFSISVLHTQAAPELFGRFGFRSGRDFDKLAGLDLHYDETTGVPMVTDGSMAVIVCRLEQSFDVGTHLIYVGETVQTRMLDPDKTPMTYDWYRQNRKGIAPPNAPTYVDKSKFGMK
jgi:flavin reductase (DIM6/NTAB) family NADH-FMN oxidoreductase RutF